MGKELGVTSLPQLLLSFQQRGIKKEKDGSFHEELTSRVQAWSLLFSCHHLVAMATAHRRRACEEKEKCTGDNLDFIASLCEEVLADNFWSLEPKCPLIDNMLLFYFPSIKTMQNFCLKAHLCYRLWLTPQPPSKYLSN